MASRADSLREGERVMVMVVVTSSLLVVVISRLLASLLPLVSHMPLHVLWLGMLALLVSLLVLLALVLWLWSLGFLVLGMMVLALLRLLGLVWTMCNRHPSHHHFRSRRQTCSSLRLERSSSSGSSRSWPLLLPGPSSPQLVSASELVLESELWVL